MAEPFVPLEPSKPSPAAPAAASPSAPPLKVLPAAGGAGMAFTAFTVRPPALHAHGASPAESGPIVTLQKDGDVVTGIRIECVCGQVIDLSCVY